MVSIFFDGDDDAVAFPPNDGKRTSPHPLVELDLKNNELAAPELEFAEFGMHRHLHRVSGQLVTGSEGYGGPHCSGSNYEKAFPFAHGAEFLTIVDYCVLSPSPV